MAQSPLPQRRKSIYLLPNLFTTGCLFSGFYAIVMAMDHRFIAAGVAILVAMVLDSLDGRVARLTNTTSDFGAQYDSMADMVSFGVAPALVAYEWALRDMGRLGWAAAFVYVAGAALRLARFNARINIVDKRFFQGVPSPAAAALVASLIIAFVDLVESGALVGLASSGRLVGQGWLNWAVWGTTVLAGLAMVSNLPYYSFKDVQLRRSVPFLAIMGGALLVTLIAQDPPLMIFGLLLIYVASGPVVWFLRQRSGLSRP